MNHQPLPLKLKIAIRRFIRDARVTSLWWLLVSAVLLAIIISFVVGLQNYADFSLFLLNEITSVSANTVLAIATSIIAVIVFMKEVPSFSQRLTKRGEGQSVAPSKVGPDQSVTPVEAGLSFNPHGIARRYMLESVTFSIQTNDPKVLSSVLMVVESKETPLYEGGISIGNDLLSGDASVGLAGYYSVTREIQCGFTGDLKYTIVNHSKQNLMCYTIFRVRSVHGLGELLIEKYMPAISAPLVFVIRAINCFLAFKPDYWVRKTAAMRKMAAIRNKRD